MRVVPLKSSNCAASLNTSESAQSVPCTFCGTACRIKHRTGIIAQLAPLPSAWTNQCPIPVLSIRHDRPRLIVATMLLPFLIIGVTFSFVCFVKNWVYESSQSAKVKAKEGYQSSMYAGFGNSLLSDIDGAGVIDGIGHIRYTPNRLCKC